MDVILPERLEPVFLLTSVILASITVYGAGSMGRQVLGVESRSRLRFVVLGSVPVGLGLWAVVFLAMGGRRYPIPATSSPLWSALALGLSVAAGALLLRAGAVEGRKWVSLVGLTVGAGAAFAGAALAELRGVAFRPLHQHDLATGELVAREIVRNFDGSGIAWGALGSVLLFGVWIAWINWSRERPQTRRSKREMAGSAGLIGACLALVQFVLARAADLIAPIELAESLVPPTPAALLFGAGAAGALSLGVAAIASRPRSDGRREQTLVLALTAGMGIIALSVGGIFTWTLYAESVQRSREQLGELVTLQAEFLEDLARLEDRGALGPGTAGEPMPGVSIDDAHPVTFSLMREALENAGSFGDTGAFQVVRLVGDSIHFIFPQMAPIPAGALVGEPSRRAARGGRGTLDGLDSRGRYVLAAIDYLPLLRVGLVAKVDVSEVRTPFLRAGLWGGFLSLILLAMGSFVFVRLARPLLKAREESSFVDAILTGAPQAVVLEGAGGRMLRGNRAFDAITGLRAGTLRGRPWREIVFDPEERTRVDAFVDRIRAGDGGVEEFRIRAASEAEVWVRAAGASVPELGADAVLVTLENVTESRASRLQVEETEARHRSLIEASSDLVWIVDRDGRWRYLNRTARRIYGADPGALIGASWFDRCAEGSEQADRSVFKKVLEGHRLEDHETIHLDAEGEERVLSVAAQPLRDRDRWIVGIQGISRDVSGRKRLESRLRAAAEDATQASRAKSSFLANMSHEIRTPLNGVMGMTELLLDTELDPDQQRALETIRISADALLAVLDDVLDLSKIEAGQLTLEKVPVDLEALVAEVACIFEVRAHRKGVEVRVEMVGDIPQWVLGDALRIRQVLNNLMSNAVKFTDQGEVHLSVEHAHDGDSSRIRCSVRDTGAGIPAAKLDMIFEEFAQADASTTRTHGGTGLGLTISRRLVAMMGGELRVDSEVGVGSRFYFEFPLEPAEASAALTTGPPAKISATPSGRALRILLAEDNPVNQMVASEMLRRRGHEVTVVSDGVQAVEAARAGGFDLILMDVQMPEMDGIAATRALREEGIEIPIVALTAHALEKEQEKTQAAGMNGFLSKPFKANELFSVVEGAAEGC